MSDQEDDRGRELRPSKAKNWAWMTDKQLRDRLRHLSRMGGGLPAGLLDLMLQRWEAQSDGRDQ